MKTAGCTVAIVGAVLFIGSLGLFGREIIRAASAHQVMVSPLEFGKTIKMPSTNVDTSQLCSISINAHVRSEYSERRTGQDRSESYDIKFAFPFQYSVYDPTGKVLMTEKRDFAYDKTKMTSESRVTEHGGSAYISEDYEKFKVSPPGKIFVEAKIDPDTNFHAEASGLRLVLSDNVTEHSKGVIGGVILLLLGGAGTLGGLVVFGIGAFRKPKRKAP
jgi:hypothetical protein